LHTSSFHTLSEAGGFVENDTACQTEAETTRDNPMGRPERPRDTVSRVFESTYLNFPNLRT